MTTEDKVKHILRKYPKTRYNRGDFMWGYCTEYCGVLMTMNYLQFKVFWKGEASIERALRDVLKDPEFALPPEQDAKRFEKAAAMKEQYK